MDKLPIMLHDFGYRLGFATGMTSTDKFFALFDISNLNVHSISPNSAKKIHFKS